MSSYNEKYNIALDCIDKHAQSILNKNKTALIVVGAHGRAPLRLTFSNLLGLTNRFANALQNLNLERGDRLVLRLPNIPEFPIAFLGAIKAGIIPIPTSPLLTWHELEFLLKDSEASALVTTEELLPAEVLKIPPFSLKQILVISRKTPSPQPSPTRGEGNTLHSSPFTLHYSRWQDLIKNAGSRFKTKPTHADDPAFWLYTSGTTGRPKAVIHAHRNIPAHDERVKLWQDVKPGDVIFNTSALNWSYALTCGMLDLWRHGLTSVIYDGELSAEKICKVIQQNHVTTLMSVPGIYRRLVEYSKERVSLEETFSKVRVCLSAGETLEGEVRVAFKKATGLEIYEGLGMTEHSVYLVQRFGEPLVMGSCGKSLPGQSIALLREDLSEADVDEPGILASDRSSPGLMLGYHHRPEEEAEAFKGPRFLSGDVARRDAGGNFFYLGRKDDVITAGGYRISPLEVEIVLNQHHAVEESAVVGQTLEPGKTIVKAFVVLKEGISANQETSKNLQDFAAKNLAKYKVPRQIIFLRELPKTPSGKIKRTELISKN